MRTLLFLSLVLATGFSLLAQETPATAPQLPQGGKKHQASVQTAPHASPKNDAPNPKWEKAVRIMDEAAKEADNQVITGNDTSHVNWTTQYIEAKGWTAIDTVRFKNKAQAELMARQGAITIAQRNLLERIQGVRIVSETTVRDMMTESDYVYKRLDGFLKGAEMVGEPISRNGMVEVTMRVPIYGPAGDDNNLAGIVAPVLNKKNQAMGQTANTASRPGAASMVAADSVLPFALNLTNAKGGKIDPALLPTVVNENGEVVLDASALYKKYGTKWIRYVKGGKRLLEELKVKGGVEILDAVVDSKGQIRLDASKVPNSGKWLNILKTAGELGRIAMMFI